MEAMRGKIPVPVEKSRLGLVIGHGGSAKRDLERLFRVTLEIDSRNSIVYIVPKEDASPYEVLKARQAITALSLGFRPGDVRLLAEDTSYLELIDLKEVSRNREDMARIKARIIGSEGKFKRLLEEMTGVRVVVGEREVGIIGDFEQVKVARDAISMILRGRSHRTVINYLKIQSRSLKRRRMELWERWESV